MRVYRHILAPGSAPGVLTDLLLCFTALLLAASTLTSRYSTIHTVNVPELPLILAGATIFAVVMPLTYAIVGLYRPAPISMLSVAGRTVFALVVGGYVTSLSLRTVADRGYIEQLLPAAIAYLAVGLLFVRGGTAALRRVAPLPRVLIIGIGPEALALATDLKAAHRNGRDVVGMYPASIDGDAPASGRN